MSKAAAVTIDDVRAVSPILAKYTEDAIIQRCVEAVAAVAA
jgi:hypothetical protein